MFFNNFVEIQDRTCVTVGNFDGVHLAHIYLLNNLRKLADENNLKTAVITFRNHTEHFLLKSNFRVLTTTAEKIKLLQESKLVDYLFVVDFDENLARLSAEQFTSILVNKLNMKLLVVGDDNKFGSDYNNFDTIMPFLAQKFSFNFVKLPSFTIDGLRVSSSLIRNLLLDGRVAEVKKYLGYDYFFISEVVKGYQIGKNLGFPTANLLVSGDKLIPKTGVYIVIVEFSGKKFRGISNIGYCPTVRSDENISFEVHILDFNENIYSKQIKVVFLERIRDEKKFETIDHLIEQIKIDEQVARNFFKNKKLQL